MGCEQAHPLEPHAPRNRISPTAPQSFFMAGRLPKFGLDFVAMSCTNCNKHEGCETEKGPQRSLIDRALSLVYPGGVWGQPDDEARFGAGLRPGEVRRLARS